MVCGGDLEESKGISKGIFSFPPRCLKKKKKSVFGTWGGGGGGGGGRGVEDGRTGSPVDARLPRGRHGRTPRHGAAHAAGRLGGRGRGGRRRRREEAGHRRHTPADHDHHRPEPGRSAGKVSLRHPPPLPRTYSIYEPSTATWVFSLHT